MRVEWLVDCGAYLSQPGPLINCVTPSQHAINAYAIPAHFYVITRRYREAIALLQKAVQIEPDLYSAHAELVPVLG